MSDDDLVKRLWLHDCEGITREAADRIEELEDQLAAVRNDTLEEAAQVAKGEGESEWFNPVQAIRALKDSK